MGEGGAPLLDEPTYDTARLTQALGEAGAPASAPPPCPRRSITQRTSSARCTSPRGSSWCSPISSASASKPPRTSCSGKCSTACSKLPIAPQITLFDVGSEVKDNVAVESLDFSRLMVGVGQKIQIRANLRNFGDAPYPDLRVYFKADGKERSAAQVRLGPHEKGQVLFSHAFDAAGSHVVEVVADADTLKADNSYLASIPVRDKVPVLLVNGDPSPEPLKGETDFAEIALQPFSCRGKVELADLIATKVIKPEELNAKALAGQCRGHPGQCPQAQRTTNSRALEEFVRNGGGLLIFPGNRSDPCLVQQRASSARAKGCCRWHLGRSPAI